MFLVKISAATFTSRRGVLDLRGSSDDVRERFAGAPACKSVGPAAAHRVFADVGAGFE
jgi:hypothetical protein